jgi:cytochrome c556
MSVIALSGARKYVTIEVSAFDKSLNGFEVFEKGSSPMLKRVLAATALCAGLATAAYAGAADDTIKARQACMKAQGASMGVMVPMMKGEKPFDAAAVKAALDANGAACADWAKFWGADTQKGETLETWAKPEIWTDAKGFEEASGKAYAATQAVAAAADEAAFKAAFPAMGAGCGGCHEKFRRPKE